MAFINSEDKNCSDKEQEQKWQVALVNLQTQVQVYKRAKSAGDKPAMDEAGAKIPDFMRAAGDAHPEPGVKEKMYKDAEEFASADEEKRERMLHPLLEGLAILITTPFALAGVALVAAGGIIYGAGRLLEGAGKILWAGPAYLWEAATSGFNSKSTPKPKSKPKSKRECLRGSCT